MDRLGYRRPAVDVCYGSEADLVLRSIYVLSALRSGPVPMKLLIGLERAHAFM